MRAMRAAGKLSGAMDCLRSLVEEVIETREAALDAPKETEEGALETAEGSPPAPPDAVSLFDVIPAADKAVGGAAARAAASLEARKRRQERAKDEVRVYNGHQLALRDAINRSGSPHSAAASARGPFKPELTRDMRRLEAEERRWKKEKRSPSSVVAETMRSHFKPGVFLGLVERDCPNVVAAARGFLAHGLSNARPERVFSLAKEIINGLSCPA